MTLDLWLYKLTKEEKNHVHVNQYAREFTCAYLRADHETWAVFQFSPW